jgi:SPP1 family predicted phage head-tail adaptor
VKSRSVAIRAGRLRSPVTIQSRTVTTDTEGNSVVAWATARREMAAVETRSAAEVLTAGQLEQDIVHVLTFHHPSAVTHESRVLLGARVLDVRTVYNVDEQNRMVQALCVERIVAV